MNVIQVKSTNLEIFRQELSRCTSGVDEKCNYNDQFALNLSTISFELSLFKYSEKFKSQKLGADKGIKLHSLFRVMSLFFFKHFQ